STYKVSIYDENNSLVSIKTSTENFIVVQGLSAGSMYRFDVIPELNGSLGTTGPAGVAATASGPNTVVTFADNNLRDALLEELDKSSNEITTFDLASLMRFQANHWNISSLSVLENAVNLKELDLSYNHISDL